MASILDHSLYLMISHVILSLVPRGNVSNFYEPPQLANNSIVLHQQAANIMLHLQSKREAAERRRGSLMSKGLASFLEKTTRVADPNSAPSLSTESLQHENINITDTPSSVALSIQPPAEMTIDVELSEPPTSDSQSTGNIPVHTHTPSETNLSPHQHSVIDKIQQTLDHAAKIIRESLELVVGGVVFLDPTIDYSGDNFVPCKVSEEVTTLGHKKPKVQDGHDNIETGKSNTSPYPYGSSPLFLVCSWTVIFVF